MSFVRQGLVVLGVGAALWVSFGALGVTGFSSTSRIGLLPPLWALLPAVLAIAALTWWPFAGRDSLTRARPAALFSLFIVLPWLPIVVPAPFLIWLGPMVALLWMGAALSALALARPRWPEAIARLLVDGRRAPFVAGAIALLIYVGASWHLADRRPGGDEPHYLIIADSLLRDGDLQIENNHQARQYLAYVDGELKPDYLRRGVNGQIYSIHAPGLPALLLPAFALAGARGAALFLALLSAVGAGLLWRVGWRVTGDSRAAWFGWAAAAFSAPFLFHAWAIYPDGAASVIALIGVIAIARAAALTPARLLLHGAVLASLPWLHTRYVLLAAAIGLAVLLRLARTADAWRRIALFLAAPIVSAIGWFGFFYAIYGTPNPSAPYGGYTQSSLESVPGGLLGLLFDQQFGLLATAPALIIALAGLGWLSIGFVRRLFVSRRAPRGGDASPARAAGSTAAPAAGRASQSALDTAAARRAARAAKANANADSRRSGDVQTSTDDASALQPAAATGDMSALAGTAAGAAAAASAELAQPGRLALELLCIIVPYAAAVAAYHMWWGGWSAPARFLVPVVLPLGVGAALGWSAARTRSSRATALIALLLGLALSATLLLVEHGRFIHNDRDGFALWTDWASPVADLAYGLPGFFRGPRPLFLSQIAVWAALLLVTWGALMLWERRLDLVARTTRDRTLAEAWQRTAPIYGAVIVPVAFACAAMFAFSFTWSMAAVPGLRPDRAQLDMLDHLRDSSRPLVLDYAPRTAERPLGGLLQMPRLSTLDEALRRISLVTASRRVPRPAPPFLAFGVPAGRYRLEPSIAGRLGGRLDVLVGRSPVPIQSYDLSAIAASWTGEPLELPLTLPVDVGMLTVRADEQAGTSVRQARLYPVASISRSEDLFPGQPASQGARYHDVTVFALTQSAYVEPGGWWVQPGAPSSFLLTREQAGTLWPLVLRNGPLPNRITLRAGSWQRELSMGPNEEQSIEVPASSPRMGRTLGLEVTAERGFRPSAVTKGSGDHRSLGVWLGVP